MTISPQVSVQVVPAVAPTFEGGSVHSATARLTNPTAAEFTYTVELYLGLTKVVTSGVSTVTIPAGGFVDVVFTLQMPVVEGAYSVYIDVWVAGSLLAHFQATQAVTIEVTPLIDIGDITWG